MLRAALLSVLIITIQATTIVSSLNNEASGIMKLTQDYIESMEWDLDFLAKAADFAPYKQVYIQKLASDSSQDVFLSAVMLGLLKVDAVIPKLEHVNIDSPLPKIGVAFALCMLQGDHHDYRKYLMKIGETTQKAGNARSLKYLEAVNLLSLLEDEGFIEYATKLQHLTEEAYQREIIDFAIQRYKRLSKERKG